MTNKSRGRNNIIGVEKHPEIIKLYNQGLTQKNIGDEFGVSQYTIYKILQMYNVKTRVKASGLTKAELQNRRELVRKMYLEGVKLDDICEILDISRGCIQGILYNSPDFKHRRKHANK